MLRYIVVVALLNGCAFFQGNRYTVVSLETSPQGAGVYKIYTKYITREKFVNENTVLLGYTPLVITAPKDANIMVVFAKDGYQYEEFIIRTGYNKVYAKDGKYHMNCIDEAHYGWILGGIVNNLEDLLTPGIRDEYCTSDRYDYEIKLKSLKKQ